MIWLTYGSCAYNYSYTITYTPSEDRILPCPAALFVKIKNTAALPLRAAYLHGPYTLHTSAYPGTFDPNAKLENPERVGVPQFEPHVKAGGNWTGRLTVPEDIRTVFGATTTKADSDSSLVNSVTWIVEIASQILFSQSASVSYELLVSRDERSLDFGLVSAMTSPVAAESHSATRHAKPVGIYSEAIQLSVEDTAILWNKPAMSEYCQKIRNDRTSKDGSCDDYKRKHSVKRRKNIHLVMVTHGLHSNTGADMLFLKESIDAAARQAKEDRRKRKSRPTPTVGNSKVEEGEGEEGEGDEGDEGGEGGGSASAPKGADTAHNSARDEEEDEDVIVRGFHENVVRTERGIQYLGKRLAKYILQLTYPDQPFLPAKKSIAKKLSNRLTNGKLTSGDDVKTAPAPTATTTRTTTSSSSSQTENAERQHKKTERLAYRFTSISFIGHSLGGLVQTYAVAYIQKHSPVFFDVIKPINFIAIASPMLGLSNENPVYVKFALDFGLVGRTGQDLGLFWRPPTFARTGWGAVVGSFGGNRHQKQQQQDPRAKPLLRILPTGPAHQVLKRFRNRTLYCNVVNDGIVPLRTCCLLFLDWKGLERVEKARRDNGLIGTVAGWGWGEIVGSSSAARASRNHSSANSISGEVGYKNSTEVPQPPEGIITQESESEAAAMGHSQDLYPSGKEANKAWIGSAALNSPITTIWSYLRPAAKTTTKDYKMYRRSQTMAINSEAPTLSSRRSEEREESEADGKDRRRIQGDSYTIQGIGLNAPPKTTVFESARDLLSPSIPPTSWLIDPSQRARTIFHDKVYHPEDIPSPPAHKKCTLNFHTTTSSNEASAAANDPSLANVGSMKVEEKIARAYHRDMAWRKVLVRLEPDAHNNIIVRRMFSNAYGWPVVKHLCDTHFADTYAAATSDGQESAVDRANTKSDTRGLNGEEVIGQSTMQKPGRSPSENREAADELRPLSRIGSSINRPAKLNREDSTVWDDTDFGETSDDDDDDDNDYLERRSIMLRWSEDRSSSQSGEIRQNFHHRDSRLEIADQIVQSPSSMMSSGILENGTVKTERDSQEDQLLSQKEQHYNSLETLITPPTSPGTLAGVGLNRTFTDILSSTPTAEHTVKSRNADDGVREEDDDDDIPVSGYASSKLNS